MKTTTQSILAYYQEIIGRTILSGVRSRSGNALLDNAMKTLCDVGDITIGDHASATLKTWQTALDTAAQSGRSMDEKTMLVNMAATPDLRDAIAYDVKFISWFDSRGGADGVNLLGAMNGDARFVFPVENKLDGTLAVSACLPVAISYNGVTCHAGDYLVQNAQTGKKSIVIQKDHLTNFKEINTVDFEDRLAFLPVGIGAAGFDPATLMSIDEEVGWGAETSMVAEQESALDFLEMDGHGPVYEPVVSETSYGFDR